MSDDYYSAAAHLGMSDAVERWHKEKRAEEFKKRLASRVRAGTVKQQSATQYASTVLGKPVKYLDELSEEDFNNLMLALNGGKISG